MGYTTDFFGSFTLNKPLHQPHFEWLENFASERHEGSDYPSIWCQWVPIDDLHIGWDEGEKFYSYVEWIKWLIKNFFKPHGYVLNGEVEWHGEEYDDIGRILIKDNIVTVKLGKIVYDL